MSKESDQTLMRIAFVSQDYLHLRRPTTILTTVARLETPPVSPQRSGATHYRMRREVVGHEMFGIDTSLLTGRHSPRKWASEDNSRWRASRLLETKVTPITVWQVRQAPPLTESYVIER